MCVSLLSTLTQTDANRLASIPRASVSPLSLKIRGETTGANACRRAVAPRDRHTVPHQAQTLTSAQPKPPHNLNQSDRPLETGPDSTSDAVRHAFPGPLSHNVSTSCHRHQVPSCAWLLDFRRPNFYTNPMVICNARTRTGTLCRRPALAHRARCYLHGSRGGRPPGYPEHANSKASRARTESRWARARDVLFSAHAGREGQNRQDA